MPEETRSESARTAIDLHAAVWLVPAAMLVVAVFPLPYGYYTLLRLVVCVAASVLVWQELRARGGVSAWTVGLALVALLFNPIVPIYLDREAWLPIDLAAAAALGTHWWRRRG